jgi:hypothetical protein
VAATVTLPLVNERVYPSVRFPVTVKVRVPEAVPFSLGVPTTKYLPSVLVIVIICPTETLTRLCVEMGVLRVKGPLCWNGWLQFVEKPAVQPSDSLVDAPVESPLGKAGVLESARAAPGDDSAMYVPPTTAAAIMKVATATISVALRVVIAIVPFHPLAAPPVIYAVSGIPPE